MTRAINGCRWCGVLYRDHVQLWTEGVGWHSYEEPTPEQRKERAIVEFRRRVERIQSVERT